MSTNEAQLAKPLVQEQAAQAEAAERQKEKTAKVAEVFRFVSAEDALKVLEGVRGQKEQALTESPLSKLEVAGPVTEKAKTQLEELAQTSGVRIKEVAGAPEAPAIESAEASAAEAQEAILADETEANPVTAEKIAVAMSKLTMEQGLSSPQAVDLDMLQKELGRTVLGQDEKNLVVKYELDSLSSAVKPKASAAEAPAPTQPSTEKIPTSRIVRMQALSVEAPATQTGGETLVGMAATERPQAQVSPLAESVRMETPSVVQAVSAEAVKTMRSEGVSTMRSAGVEATAPQAVEGPATLPSTPMAKTAETASVTVAETAPSSRTTLRQDFVLENAPATQPTSEAPTAVEAAPATEPMASTERSATLVGVGPESVPATEKTGTLIGVVPASEAPPASTERAVTGTLLGVGPESAPATQPTSEAPRTIPENQAVTTRLPDYTAKGTLRMRSEQAPSLGPNGTLVMEQPVPSTQPESVPATEANTVVSGTTEAAAAAMVAEAAPTVRTEDKAKTLSMEEKRAIRKEKMDKGREIVQGLADLAQYSSSESIEERQQHIDKLGEMLKNLSEHLKANPDVAGSFGDEITKLAGALESNKGLQEKALDQRRKDEAAARAAIEAPLESAVTPEQLVAERELKGVESARENAEQGLKSLEAKFDALENFDLNTWNDQYLGYGVKWTKSQWEALSSDQSPDAPFTEKQAFKQLRLQALGGEHQLMQLNEHLKVVRAKMKALEATGAESLEMQKLKRQENDMLMEQRKVEELNAQTETAEKALLAKANERIEQAEQAESAIETATVQSTSQTRAEAQTAKKEEGAKPGLLKRGMWGGAMVGAAVGLPVFKAFRGIAKGVGWFLGSFMKAKTFGDAVSHMWDDTIKRLDAWANKGKEKTG